eukprot:gene30700-35730_t
MIDGKAPGKAVSYSFGIEFELNAGTGIPIHTANGPEFENGTDQTVTAPVGLLSPSSHTGQVATRTTGQLQPATASASTPFTVGGTEEDELFTPLDTFERSWVIANNSFVEEAAVKQLKQFLSNYSSVEEAAVKQLKQPVNGKKLKRWAVSMHSIDGAWAEGDPSKWLADWDLGTVGGGNHFAELQVVEEVVDKDALVAMGIDPGQLLLLVHSGSRGLGQQVLSHHLDQHGTAPLMEGTQEFDE